MTRAYVGLDVGGTASRWVACDGAGQVLARGSTGGATAHVFNPAEHARLTAVFQQVGAALANAALEPAGLCVGMTGFGQAAASEIRRRTFCCATLPSRERR